MTYQHSTVFARLKSRPESISDNLTSGQYLSILDTLLFKALEPIVLTTNCFDAFVARLMGWQELHTKRKVSLLERADFAPIAAAWLASPTRVAKVTGLPRLKLDRASVFEFIHSFLETTDCYEQACDAALVLDGHALSISDCLAYKHNVEKALRADGSLLAARGTAKHWVTEASEFKNKILEKYIRLCLTAARSDYQTTFDTKVPLDDLIQTYVVAASRAIDKCDSNQGALTSHVRYWFFTARSAVQRAHDPHGAVESGEQEDLASEELPTHQLLENRQAMEQLRELASLVDPLGYGRAYLGIQEAQCNLTVNSRRYSSLVMAQRTLRESRQPQPTSLFANRTTR